MKDIGVKIHTYLAGWEPCLQTSVVSGKALCLHLGADTVHCAATSQR